MNSEYAPGGPVTSHLSRNTRQAALGVDRTECVSPTEELITRHQLREALTELPADLGAAGTSAARLSSALWLPVGN